MESPDTLSEWATLVQDRAGWMKLVTKVPFDLGKPQLKLPLCDISNMPEKERRFLPRRAQEIVKWRALFNAETDTVET